MEMNHKSGSMVSHLEASQHVLVYSSSSSNDANVLSVSPKQFKIKIRPAESVDAASSTHGVCIPLK